MRPLDSDVSGVRGAVWGCGLLLTDGCLAEDDYVPTSGGESDGESGEEKSGVDDTLHSDCEEEGEEEEEEPVTTAKKVLIATLCTTRVCSINFVACTY